MNAYMNQYQNNQILTATPEQILLMLYDGAIRFCRQAIAANEVGNVTLKLEHISKTFAIITEFSSSLNHEIGGDIAENLDALYHFMLRELNHARKDTASTGLRNVEKLLVDLRVTWGEAVEINKKEQSSVPLPPQEVEKNTQIPTKRFSAAG